MTSTRIPIMSKQGGAEPTMNDYAVGIAKAADPVSAANVAADDIVRGAKDVKVASDRLMYLRRLLRAQGAPVAAVAATKRPEVTTAANKARPPPYYERDA